jgi:hypothetical protein
MVLPSSFTVGFFRIWGPAKKANLPGEACQEDHKEHFQQDLQINDESWVCRRLNRTQNADGPRESLDWGKTDGDQER